MLKPFDLNASVNRGRHSLIGRNATKELSRSVKFKPHVDVTIDKLFGVAALQLPKTIAIQNKMPQQQGADVAAAEVRNEVLANCLTRVDEFLCSVQIGGSRTYVSCRCHQNNVAAVDPDKCHLREHLLYCSHNQGKLMP